MNFNELKIRASQSHKIMTGALPVKEDFNSRIKELENERDTLINVNGNKVKWTENKKTELSNLITKRDTPFFELMPKTFKSECKKLYRSEKYDRVFNFINKFTAKGIVQEDEAITCYMMHLNSLGIKVFFRKNEEQFSNDFVKGTPDLLPIEINNKKIGFDIKASWDLETFPFPEDELPSVYFWQNQCYLWLTDSDEWRTAYCLVNLHEHGLHNEKMKYFYPYGCPETEDDKYYHELIQQYRELEKRYIFDYDRFIHSYPYHNLEISRDEWYDNNWDIPIKDRVVEKTTYRCEDSIEELKNRVKVARKYLNSL